MVLAAQTLRRSLQVPHRSRSSMGSTSRAPVEVQDVVPQPEQMHGGPARHKHATAANAAAAAAGAGTKRCA